MYRRELLGAGIVIVSSGCLTDSGDEADTSSSKVTLGKIEISNFDDAPHDAEIELYADGDLVYNERYSVGSAADRDTTSTIVVERDWPASVEQYTLRGRFDDREWLSFVFDEPHSKTCHIAKLHISEGGDYDIYTATTGADESLC